MCTGRSDLLYGSESPIFFTINLICAQIKSETLRSNGWDFLLEMFLWFIHLSK